MSLEAEDELLIVAEDLAQAREEGVRFRPQTALVRVLADDEGNVRGAVLCQASLQRDEHGAVTPQLTEGTEVEVPCDTILVAIGQVQVLDWLPADCTERGLVRADEYGRIPHPSGTVFTGGDVMRGPSMVVDALGDGKRAARDIDRVLSAEPLRPDDPVEVMPYEKLNTAYFRHAPRTEAPLAPATTRRTSQVTEVTLAYSREQALAEADRCMSCGVCNGCDNCYIVCPDVSVMRDTRENGHYSIRTHYCKGCLVCVQECPTGCLERVPELDFDEPDAVVRMETAFAPYDGAHAEQAPFTRQLIEDAIAEYDAARTQETINSSERAGCYAMTTVHVDVGTPPRLKRAIRTPDGERFLAGLAGTRVRQNGCAAAAYAALYANVDVITAYPIRPYTAIMMNLAQFVADGILDAEYIHADGEHSQFSAAFGAASCGARAYTGSSGVGVTYGYEMYSIISGARIPVQMAIADRTLDPPGDFGSEHTDALCTRDMGWLMGWAATPQEVFDKSLLAFAIGEDPRVLLPQMVVQDGYFVSHIAGEVDMPAAETGGRVPAPVPAAVPAGPAAAGVARPADPSRAGTAAAARAGPGDGGRDPGDPGEDRRVRPGLRPDLSALRRVVPAGGRRARDRHLRRARGHLPGRDQPAARAGDQDRHGPPAVGPAVPQRRPAGGAARASRRSGWWRPTSASAAPATAASSRWT